MKLLLFYLMVFLLPFFATSPWQRLFGIPVGFIYSFVVVLVFFQWLKQQGFRRLFYRMKATPLMGGLIIFLLINIISVIVAGPAMGVQEENIVRLLYLAFSLLVFFLTYNVVANKEVLLKAIHLFILGCFLGSLYGIYQTGGYMLGFQTGQMMTWTVPRLFGTSTEPQVFGNLLIPAVTLAAGLFMARDNNRDWGKLGVPLMVMLLAMVMTFSAGGWIGAAVSVALLFLGIKCLDPRKIIGFVVILAVVFSSVIIIERHVYPGYLSGFPSLFVKFSSKPPTEVKPAEEMSIRSRDDRVWYRAAAWKMFRESPLIGVGTGNYRYLYNQYRPSEAPEVSYIPKAHNQYLEILAETGIMGFGVLLFMIVQLGRMIWRGIALGRDRHSRLILWILAASLVGLGVHGLAFGIFVHNYLWVILGMLCAAVVISTRRGAEGI